MAASEIRALLKDAGGELPLYLTRVRLNVVLQPAGREEYADEERRRFVTEDLAEGLASAIRAGFFCGRNGAGEAVLTPSFDRDGNLSFQCASAKGFHHNAVTALLRYAIDLHHVPLDSYNSTKEILEEEGVPVPPRRVADQLISALQIADVEALDGRRAVHTDLFDYVVDEEIPLPKLQGFNTQITEYCQAERAIATGQDKKQALANQAFSDIEDAFLRMCGSSIFKKIEDYDSSSHEGDADIWLRYENGQELVLDGYDGELYGLIEFINAASGSRADAFELQDDD